MSRRMHALLWLGCLVVAALELPRTLGVVAEGFARPVYAAELTGAELTGAALDRAPAASGLPRPPAPIEVADERVADAARPQLAPVTPGDARGRAGVLFAGLAEH